MSENKELSYWESHDPPMSFIPEGWTYEKKRDFRYRCIPYLPSALGIDTLAGRARWKGKRVLCVGDGSGIDAVEIASCGADVYVLDMSAKAVKLSLAHGREAGAIVCGEVGDACSITFKDETFDVVYSFGVIHHIPDVERAVREIARVLKRGGQFVGMVYNRDSLLYAYSILKRGHDEGLGPVAAMREYSERNPGCPHSVAYSKDGLARLLRGCGFSSVDTKVEYDVIDLPNKRKTPFHIEGVDDLGWHLFFTAIK